MDDASIISSLEGDRVSSFAGEDVGTLDDLHGFELVDGGDEDWATTGSDNSFVVNFPSASSFVGDATSAVDASDNEASIDDGCASVAASDAQSSVQDSAASSLRCPLTLDRLRDPAFCRVDGRVYERHAIEQWVREHGSSPFTRQPVNLTQLRRLSLAQLPLLPATNGASIRNTEDSDTASISTAAGWPRIPSSSATAAETQDGREVSIGEVVDRPSYLQALITGGGGLESDQALVLTQPRPVVRRKRVSVSTSNEASSPTSSNTGNYAYKRRAGAEKPEEEDIDSIEDLAYDEWSFRKGLGARNRLLARRDARNVLGRRNKRRYGASSVYGGLRIGPPVVVSGFHRSSHLVRLGRIDEIEVNEEDDICGDFEDYEY